MLELYNGFSPLAIAVIMQPHVALNVIDRTQVMRPGQLAKTFWKSLIATREKQVRKFVGSNFEGK